MRGSPNPEWLWQDTTPIQNLSITQSLNVIWKLRGATDADGRKLEVVVLEAPSSIREEFASADFAAGYINFYVCNRAVIAPEFGDQKADLAAKKSLQNLFPGREIVQINIDGIASGGGGIHCTTQQEPLVHG